MTEKAKLIKCSRCKSTLLSEYFSKNRKGDYFKCCDNCKHNKKDKQVTLTEKRDEENINKARTEWIHSIIDNSKKCNISHSKNCVLINCDNITLSHCSNVKLYGVNNLTYSHCHNLV